MKAVQQIRKAKATGSLAIYNDHKVTAKVGQSRQKPARISKIMIPAPQSERIMQRYVAGESIREIARVESRDRATVSKVVKSQDMADYVIAMREKLYSVADDAITTVRKAIQAGDARLSYEFLKDIGVVPSREHAIQVKTL